MSANVLSRWPPFYHNVETGGEQLFGKSASKCEQITQIYVSISGPSDRGSLTKHVNWDMATYKMIIYTDLAPSAKLCRIPINNQYWVLAENQTIKSRCIEKKTATDYWPITSRHFQECVSQFMFYLHTWVKTWSSEVTCQFNLHFPELFESLEIVISAYQNKLVRNFTYKFNFTEQNWIGGHLAIKKR